MAKHIFQITFSWKTREREKRIVTTQVEMEFEGEITTDILRVVRDKARVEARLLGYPGHQGGRYNYMIDDWHNWIAKKGWTNCACHPKDVEQS